jgi:hypothetical protein
MSKAQYKTIQGIKYERDLLDMAERETSRGNTLTKAGAEKIWEQALDGNRITTTERRTVEYIMDNFQVALDARTYFQAQLAAPVPSLKRKATGYYQTIGGISYDRVLLEQAKARAAASGGHLTFQDAIYLYGKANDGSGVTECEKRTLKYIAQQHALQTDAHEFFSKSLAIDIPSPAIGDRPSQNVAAIEDRPGLLGGLFTSMWRKITGGSADAGPVEASAHATRALTDLTPNSDVQVRSDQGASHQPDAKRRREEHSAQPCSLGTRAALQDAAERRPAAVAAVAMPDSSTTGTHQDMRHPEPGAFPKSHEAPLPTSSSAASEDDLNPALQQLLAELNGTDGHMLQLELPESQTPEDVEQAALKAKAAAEAERILSARSVAEILGGGDRQDQKREFKRIVLLLHPDKGLVDPTDKKAGLALRLARGALSKTRSN